MEEEAMKHDNFLHYKYLFCLSHNSLELGQNNKAGRNCH